jgi:hypothetical protein
MEPNLSAGANTAQLIGEVEALLANGWMLDEEQRGLQKTYYFKTYTKCLVYYYCLQNLFHPLQKTSAKSLLAGFRYDYRNQKQVEKSPLHDDDCM